MPKNHSTLGFAGPYRRYARDIGHNYVPILLFIIPLVVLGSGLVRGKTNNEVETRHQVLSDLLGRGQLTVELFPPLSYFLSVFLLSSALTIIARGSRLTMAHMVAWDSALDAAHTSTRLISAQRRWWPVLMSCYILALLIPLYGTTMSHEESALEASSALAACTLILAAVLRRIPSWAAQVLVITAGMLGCNALDWAACYARVTVRGFANLLSDIPAIPPPNTDPPLSPRVLLRVAWHTVFALT